MSNYWRGFGLQFGLIALFRLDEEQESIARKVHKFALAYNLEGVPQEAFLALSFDGHTPQGKVTFHEGFKKECYDCECKID